MTFCTPVSVSSPKLWALSFYHGTLTKESFLDDPASGENNDPSTGILQLLTFDQRHLVPILGKNSGREVDKSAACRDEGFAWWSCSKTEETYAEDNREDNSNRASCNHDCEVLPGCAIYIQVEYCRSSNSIVDAGDHVVAICKVMRTGIWQPCRDDEIEGSILWLDKMNEGTTISLTTGAIDESNALYSGQLRREGII